MTDKQKANEEKSQELMYCVLKEHTWDIRKQIAECAIYMAEWKDEQHSKEKRQWIEKACEWLKENIDDYYATGDGGDEFEEWFDDMFEDFREAMKGE